MRKIMIALIVGFGLATSAMAQNINDKNFIVTVAPYTSAPYTYLAGSSGTAMSFCEAVAERNSVNGTVHKAYDILITNIRQENYGEFKYVGWFSCQTKYRYEHQATEHTSNMDGRFWVVW